jgi:aspartyl aminopeptidase
MENGNGKDKKSALAMDRENGWNLLDEQELALLEKYAADYMGFISTAKTERKAHDIAVALAEKCGFKNIESCSGLKTGDRIYRSYRGRTLLLARIGKRPVSDGVNIVGGHIDAPRLDLKPNPLYEDSELAMLDTHYYGGIKK